MRAGVEKGTNDIGGVGKRDADTVDPSIDAARIVLACCKTDRYRARGDDSRLPETVHPVLLNKQSAADDSKGIRFQTDRCPGDTSARSASRCPSL